jgi:uncharacterized membrane protein YtjA (UPF0391 family)
MMNKKTISIIVITIAAVLLFAGIAGTIPQ